MKAAEPFLPADLGRLSPKAILDHISQGLTPKPPTLEQRLKGEAYRLGTFGRGLIGKTEETIGQVSEAGRWQRLKEVQAIPQMGLGERLERGIPGKLEEEVPPMTQLGQEGLIESPSPAQVLLQPWVPEAQRKKAAEWVGEHVPIPGAEQVTERALGPLTTPATYGLAAIPGMALPTAASVATEAVVGAAAQGRVPRWAQTPIEVGAGLAGFGLPGGIKKISQTLFQRGAAVGEEVAAIAAAEKPPILPPGKYLGRLEVGTEHLAREQVEQAVRLKYSQSSLPTIREVEARSRPLPPEVRAELLGTPQTRVPLSAPEEVEALWGERYMQNWWTKFEDFMGGPFARTPEARAVRRLMVSRDIYAATQGVKMDNAVWEWLARARRTLGVGMDGVARKVKVRPGVDIPRGLERNIEHIATYPEKYIVPPGGEAILQEADDLATQVARMQQRLGIDVREIEGPYFHRITTKFPKGDPLGVRTGRPRLGTKPGHAKMRLFGDLEEKYRLGYRQASPVEALFVRLRTGVDSIGNARAVSRLKELGLKPSEAYRSDIVQAAREAREEYKLARATASRAGASADDALAAKIAETKLDDATRALRVERTRWRETQPKVFGRIVSPEVAEEFARYSQTIPEGMIEQALLLMRSNSIWADLSQAGIQGWYLAGRNNIAWWKTLAYGVYSLVSEPVSYFARNYEVMSRAADVGAIRAPTEWLMRSGGSLSQRFGELPGVKQTQRAFEMMTTVGQTERYKAIERLARTPDELLELAGVIREESGTLLMPGLTSAQAKVLSRTFFAGQFFVAIHKAPFSILRGGVAGREAAKALSMAFGGSLALTIGLNYKFNGTLPNLTDPDKPGFLGIKLGEGYVYPFGPYQPALVMLARTGRALDDAAQGKKPSARDLQAFPRFLESKGSIPVRTFVAVLDVLGVPLTAIRGEPYEYLRLETADDWKRWAAKYMPMAPTQAARGLKVGFPAALLEILGIRTNPMPTWGGIDLEVQGMGFKNSRGDAIEHYRDLTEPQKIEAEKNPRIKTFMARAEAHDDTSKAFAAIETERGRRLEAAFVDLATTGPVPDALDRYADSVAQTKQDIAAMYRFLEMSGLLGEGEVVNPDLKLLRQFQEYTGRAVGPDGLLNGELYGQYEHNYRQIIGEELARTVLDPQLMADRNPQLQQWQVWSRELGDSGYYDLVKKDGSSDAEARIRFRAANPEYDATGYLLGRWPKVQTQVAGQLAQDMFSKWMGTGVGETPTQR